jgi:hypothetical protein
MRQYDHQKLPPGILKSSEITSASADSSGSLYMQGGSYSTPLVEKLYISASSIAIDRPTITSFAGFGPSEPSPYYGDPPTPPAQKIAKYFAS